MLSFFKDHFEYIHDIFHHLNWKQLGNMVKKNPNFIMPNLVSHKEQVSINEKDILDVPYDRQIELKIV